MQHQVATWVQISPGQLKEVWQECSFNTLTHRLDGEHVLFRKGVVRYVLICMCNLQRSGSAHYEQDVSALIDNIMYSTSAMSHECIFGGVASKRAQDPHYLFAPDAYA